MRIIAISDTHGFEYKLNLPKGDILIHTGDFNIDSLLRLHEVNEWLGGLNYSYKIICMGNHDSYSQHIGRDWCKQLFTNAIYLQDEEVIINGIKFYGSPWSPEFNNWSWMYPRRSLEAKNIWEKIPRDIDILITHTMPYGFLDTNYKNEHCGCEVLAREIFNKKVKIQIGGHLHNEGGNILVKDDIKFCNVSVLDEDYKLTHKPTILEI